MSYRPGISRAALASATSANGSTRNGATLAMALVSQGTLSVSCTSTITTTSVIPTFTLQVTRDGTTWFDLRDVAGVAPVAFPTGTGSPVTTRRALCLPQAAYAWPYVRCNAVLAGATTDPADLTVVDYQYTRYGAV